MAVVRKVSGGVKIGVSPKNGGFHDKFEATAFLSAELEPGESPALALAVLFQQGREACAVQARAYKEMRRLELADLLVGLPEETKELLLAQHEDITYMLAGDIERLMAAEEAGNGE